jgi:hypothetical protein
MVVKNEKQVEGIREILKRLESFFSEDIAQDTDRKTLIDMEHGLINMECKLQLFSQYRRKDFEVS